MSAMDELQKKMAEAMSKNDVKAIEAIASEIVKSKADRHKAEAEGLRKEAEAMAGAREKLATAIHGAVKGLGLDVELTKQKAWGFTYKVDKAVPNEPDTSYKSVSLSTQQVKARASGEGGGAGKTKDEYGMSLSEVFEKFATDDDRVKLAEAKAKDDETLARTGKTNQGYQYNVRKEVKKQALASGALAPVK